MLLHATYRHIFRASAWYDLLVTAAFATPWTLALIYSVFALLHDRLGLPPLQKLSVEGVLFTNFFGSVVLVWALLRLRSDMIWMGRYDALTRALFSLWMIHALLQGASPLLWGFLVIEVAFAMLQVLPHDAKEA